MPSLSNDFIGKGCSVSVFVSLVNRFVHNCHQGVRVFERASCCSSAEGASELTAPIECAQKRPPVPSIRSIRYLIVGLLLLKITHYATVLVTRYVVYRIQRLDANRRTTSMEHHRRRRSESEIIIFWPPLFDLTRLNRFEAIELRLIVYQSLAPVKFLLKIHRRT